MPWSLRRDRALDHEHVLARVLAHRRAQRRLGLGARGRHQRLVVVERDQVEDQLAEVGLRRAQQRLGAAGAVLEVQPDHRQPPRLRRPRARPRDAWTLSVIARPNGAATISSPQNSRNSRRLTPQRTRCWPIVSVRLHAFCRSSSRLLRSLRGRVRCPRGAPRAALRSTQPLADAVARPRAESAISAGLRHHARQRVLERAAVEVRQRRQEVDLREHARGRPCGTSPGT